MIMHDWGSKKYFQLGKGGLTGGLPKRRKPAIISINIIAEPVRARPKGGQIPKRTVCNRQEDHVRRT